MSQGRKFGHTVSLETRAKIAASLKGRSYDELGREPMSAEARDRSSLKNSGKHPERSHTVSPEARARIGVGNKGQRRAKVETARTIYARTHATLRNNFPLVGVCSRCSAEGRTERAFKYHPDVYTENNDDYLELCITCHRNFDVGDRMMALRYWADAGRPGRVLG